MIVIGTEFSWSKLTITNLLKETESRSFHLWSTLKMPFLIFIKVQTNRTYHIICNHMMPISKQFALKFCLGNLLNEDEVLGWLIHQMKNDEIEEVTDEMLEKLVDNHEHVALVICKKCYTLLENHSTISTSFLRR